MLLRKLAALVLMGAIATSSLGTGKAHAQYRYYPYSYHHYHHGYYHRHYYPPPRHYSHYWHRPPGYYR